MSIYENLQKYRSRTVIKKPDVIKDSSLPLKKSFSIKACFKNYLERCYKWMMNNNAQHKSEVKKDHTEIDLNQSSKEPSVVENNCILKHFVNHASLVLITLKLILWLLLFILFIELEFGAVFFACSLLYFICTNLNNKPKKPSELSAYSVFNPNCEAIEGSLKAEQFEREIRFGIGSMH